MVVGDWEGVCVWRRERMYMCTQSQWGRSVQLTSLWSAVALLPLLKLSLRLAWNAEIRLAHVHKQTSRGSHGLKMNLWELWEWRKLGNIVLLTLGAVLVHRYKTCKYVLEKPWAVSSHAKQPKPERRFVRVYDPRRKFWSDSWLPDVHLFSQTLRS